MQQKGHRGRKTQRTKKGENNLPIPRTFFDESVPLLPPLSSGNSADESALLSVHVPFRFVPDVRRYTWRRRSVCAVFSPFPVSFSLLNSPNIEKCPFPWNYKDGHFSTLEMEGIEPSSKKTSKRVSPSAVYFIWFPNDRGNKQTKSFGSFIDPTCGQSLAQEVSRHSWGQSVCYGYSRRTGRHD